MQEVQSGDGKDIAVLVGQLLNATTTATQSLQNVTQLVQQNAQAIAVAVKTLELVESQVEDIEKLVADPANEHNLLQTLQQHTTQLQQLREQGAQLRAAVATMRKDIAKLMKGETRDDATKKTLNTTLMFIGWLVTTIISGLALYFAK